MRRELQDKIVVGICVLLCFALYFNSLWNGFVFDDLHSLKENAYIKDLRHIPLFFKGYFTSFPVPKGMFRPLLMLTFVFNYLFSGPVPLGYHLINILLHFLNTILLYSILRLLLKKAPFGLILAVTLLFLVHPLNVEAVSYIISRSDLLVTSFIALGILTYDGKKRLLTLLCYSAALLSKETAIAFGPFVILYDFVYERLEWKNREAVKSWLKARGAFYAGLFALTAIYLWYRKVIFGGIGNIYPMRSMYSNVLTQSFVTLYYLRLFLFPAPLSVYHDLPILNSLSSPLAIIGVLAICAAIILIFACRKRWPAVSLGLGWILAGLAPKFYGTLNVVASEHHFYLASFGIYLILAYLTQSLYIRWKRYYVYIASALIGVCVLLTWFRNFEWKDGLTLWKIEAKRSPTSATAHNNLGYEYLRAGLYQEAEEEFRRVFSIPAAGDVKVNAAMNLAAIRRIQGRYAEALAELQKIKEWNPKYAGVYNEIGIVYESMGRFNDAEKEFKEGLNLYLSSPQFTTNLGFLYYAQGKLDLAQEYFQKALQYAPDFALAHFGLGEVWEAKGENSQAQKAYEKSVKFDPSYPKSHYALGTLYARKGDGRALAALQEAVRLEPSFAPAYNNLAVLYASMEPPKLELAREYARKAMALGYKVDDEFLRRIGVK